MRISNVGGIIAAAGQKPLLEVGSIAIIRRIVLSYQRAGIFPIVVVADSAQVQRALSGLGVIFLPNGNETELMDSVRVGLRYLLGKCGKVAYTPANVPMFTHATLLQLINCSERIVIPSYHGKGGHPVMLDQSVLGEILEYNGEDGLRGALRSCSVERTWLNVEDKGIVTNVNDAEELEQQSKVYHKASLYPTVSIQLERETPFFTPRLKLLLFLIGDTENMRTSCAYANISHSKAWEMINILEHNIGYPVVERQRGGKTGGSTSLTERGKKLLLAYQAFEEQIQKIAQSEFYNSFIRAQIV